MSGTFAPFDSKKDSKASRIFFGIQMRRVQFLWRTAINEAVSELGLTEARWTVLVHLQKLGEGSTPLSLAHSLGIEMPSLTRTLQQLVAMDLIEKHTNEHDGRSQCLCFSPTGHQILAQLTPIVESIRQRLFTDIESAKLDIMAEVMEQMEHNATQLLAENRQPNEREE